MNQARDDLRPRHGPAVTVEVRTLQQSEIQPAFSLLVRAFGGAPHPADTALCAI